MIERRFNLIDEAWIPVTGRGLVSLKQIFSDTTLSALGGDPVQKIAILKLLLAIAQSACTPEDTKAWKDLGIQGMCKKVLAYLDTWHDAFWLYGNTPFLQIPAIEKAEKKSYGTVLPMVATGNTTVLTQIHIEKPLSDAEKAQVLVQLMGFALGGKKTDNSVVLTPGYRGKSNEKGKPSTGKPGPSVGFKGFLHSFVMGSSLAQTVWLNLFTGEELTQIKFYPAGIGVAPWERMPQGEDDEVARQLKGSYMGRLVPLCRFVLLKEDGLHYSEGIAHPDYTNFVVDPSVAVDFSSKKPRVIWVDTEKKPWRQLTALLSFMGDTSNKNTFECLQLKTVIQRLTKTNLESFAIWSGGMQASSNAGEQYFSGNDDFVESEVQLSASIFKNESIFYATLQEEMDYMERMASILWASVKGYYADSMADGTNFASQATSLFWQLCERDFQKLVTACYADSSGEKAREMRRIFEGNVYRGYDLYCPNQTARQLEAWISNRPRLWKNRETNTKEVVANHA
ncbi:MAG TPA: type I-E CRISPR-associated protein Cse1/CasA [Spirochaetales bacterium]|nr:type I-E CRISPR-associated protein Cse1/CasA [Spirochaetales bacterium]